MANEAPDRPAEARLSMALEAFGAAYFELGHDLTWRHLDHSAARVLGHPLESVPAGGEEMVRWWFDHVHAADRDAVRHAFAAVLAGKDGVRVQCRFRDAAGQELWLLIVARVGERDAEGRPVRVTGILHDATRTKLETERIHHIAHHDALTGLPNRSLLLDRIGAARERLVRDGVPFAVMMLDLDHFKDVNDTHGHPVGDELLEAVARRLEGMVRRTDTVSRLGGDEFAIVQADLRESVNCAQLAEKIIAGMEAPFEVRGHPILTNTSIGAVVAEDPDEDPNTLLAKADVALYEAKEVRGTYRLHSPELAAEARRQAQLSTDLHVAIEADDVSVAFLPQVTVKDRLPVLVEALARWQHPELGPVPACELIRRAEETGQMVALGRRIVDAALAAAARWPRPLPVAVNVSPLQLKDRRFEGLVTRALTRHGLPPQRLVLEIAEDHLATLNEVGERTLLYLAAAGVRLDIDDAGRGRTHIERLVRLPVHRIKLAQDLVAALATDPRAKKVARSVMALAASLDVPVVAEGVEQEGLLEAVRDLGVAEMQGHLVHPPMEEDELQDFLSG